MQLKDFETEDSKRVWLTPDEVDQVLATADGTEQTIALGLAARCGLRAKEIIEVTPTDIVDGPADQMVRVWHGKGSKYRETPIPRDLNATIDAYADVREDGPETPLVDRTTRTIRKWVDKVASQLEDSTGDEAWQFLSPHDLRRTWGQLMVEADVEPGMVMVWGGWEDWETFREHYLGQYSPRKQRAERKKVDWL